MGQSGLKVSELCLGTQTFGWGADEKVAHTVCNRFTIGPGTYAEPHAPMEPYRLLATGVQSSYTEP